MLKFYGGTDTGLVRKTNQDRYECRELSDRLGYAVLCDGMGGQKGGNIASDIATRFVVEMLERDLREDMGEVSIRSCLDSAVAGANAKVHAASEEDPELQGMGTTLIAAVWLGGELYVSYVGDSRVYAVTPTQELKLTKDHTVVQMLVDIGEISEQDAQSHPKRHYITRAVGVSKTVEADFIVHKLAPDEIVLLCSDGLYHYLAPGTLYGLLFECVRRESADSLIALAKESGGTDNITVVLAVDHE